VLVGVVVMLHALATWWMLGIIWLVQVVVYPLFRFVPPEALPVFAQAHVARIGSVVGPAMVLEVLTGLWLLALLPRAFKLGLWLGLALLAGIWLATLLLSIPCHQVLAHTASAEVVERLIAGNWVRTLLWSVRGMLVAWLLWQYWHTGQGQPN
jgi:hypothetical protein